MPKGRITCPICQGTGRVEENGAEYEFLTRDLRSDTCLICAGTGLVGNSTILPDGRKARILAREKGPQEAAVKPGKENRTGMNRMEGDEGAKGQEGKRAKGQKGKELGSGLRRNDRQGQAGNDVPVVIILINVASTEEWVSRIIREVGNVQKG